MDRCSVAPSAKKAFQIQEMLDILTQIFDHQHILGPFIPPPAPVHGADFFILRPPEKVRIDVQVITIMSIDFEVIF